MFNDFSIYIYFIIFHSIAIFLFYILSFSKVYYKDVFIYLLVFFISFFTGFRNINIGYDSKNYINEFLNPGSIRWKVEIGLYIYNEILRSLRISGQAYQLLTSLIINFSILRFFHKIEKRYYGILFSLYLASNIYFIFHLNIIRQGIATAFALNAIYYLYKKDWLKFLLISIIASSFHTSALFFIFSSYVAKIIIKYIPDYKTGIKCLLIFIIIIILKQNITNLLILISKLINIKYFKYIAYIIDTNKIGGYAYFKPWHWAGLLMLIVYLLKYNHTTKNRGSNDLIITYYSGFLLISLLSINMLVADRLFYYYYFIGYALILKTMYFFKEKKYIVLILLNLTILWFGKTILFQYPNWFMPPYPNMTAPLLRG